MSIPSQLTIPIDAAISQAYGTIQDDATEDLRNVIKEIDSNSAKKEQLRQVSEQLAVAKAAIDAGDYGKAHGEINKLLGNLEDAGYNQKTPLGKVASNPPEKSGANTDGDMDIEMMKWGEEGIKATKGWLDEIETLLKGEMDRHSDISSKLQVEMNTKSSILRRSEKAVSDNESAFQKNNDAILRNMKG